VSPLASSRTRHRPAAVSDRIKPWALGRAQLASARLSNHHLAPSSPISPRTDRPRKPARSRPGPTRTGSADPARPRGFGPKPPKN